MNRYEPQRNAKITDQIKEAIKHVKIAAACVQRICEQDKTVSSVFLDEINTKWMKELSVRLRNLLIDTNY